MQTRSENVSPASTSKLNQQYSHDYSRLISCMRLKDTKDNQSNIVCHHSKGRSLNNLLQLPQLQYYRNMYNRNHNAAKQFKKHSVEKQKKKEDRIMMKKLLANYNRSLHTKPSIFEGSRSQMKKKKVEKENSLIAHQNIRIAERINHQRSTYALTRKNYFKNKSKLAIQENSLIEETGKDQKYRNFLRQLGKCCD